MNFTTLLLEKLHGNLYDIADSDKPAIKKAFEFKAKVNELPDSGLYKGFSTGSSRNVYHVVEPKEINIDGKDTHIPTVFKVEQPNMTAMARFNEGKPSLGMLQNSHEASPIHNDYSILKKNKEGKYVTNEAGILAPVVDSHKNGFWLEQAKTEPLYNSVFKDHTISEHFPEGLESREFFNAIHNAWSNDTRKFKEIPYGKSSIYNHPYVKSFIEHAKKADMNGADIREHNFGTFTHPITGKKYPVMFDYGYSNQVAKEYDS